MNKLWYLFVFVLMIVSCGSDDDCDCPDTIPCCEDVKEEPFSWKGAHILWLGTSIPAGDGNKSYPSYVAEKLGATVYNESVGGSTIRASLYHGSWKGMEWYAVSRSLSHTIAEKEQFIKYFASGLDKDARIVADGEFGWKDFCSRCPDTLTDSEKELILSCSYENKIINKYLDTAHADFIVRPDVIVIDHGYNDLAHSSYDNYDRGTALSVPENPYDRSRYIGAVNYIINVITEYSPEQKIILMGHFEKEYVPAIHLGQLNLFGYWKDEYPGFKLWNELGWTQDINPETGLTYLQTNLQDNLHPHTDTRIDPESGYKLAIKQIGDACVSFFERLYDTDTNKQE